LGHDVKVQGHTEFKSKYKNQLIKFLPCFNRYQTQIVIVIHTLVPLI